MLVLTMIIVLQDTLLDQYTILEVVAVTFCVCLKIRTGIVSLTVCSGPVISLESSMKYLIRIITFSLRVTPAVYRFAITQHLVPYVT